MELVRLEGVDSEWVGGFIVRFHAPVKARLQRRSKQFWSLVCLMAGYQINKNRIYENKVEARWHKDSTLISDAKLSL